MHLVDETKYIASEVYIYSFAISKLHSLKPKDTIASQGLWQDLTQYCKCGYINIWQEMQLDPWQNHDGHVPSILRFYRFISEW